MGANQEGLGGGYISEMQQGWIDALKEHPDSDSDLIAMEYALANPATMPQAAGEYPASGLEGLDSAALPAKSADILGHNEGFTV